MMNEKIINTLNNMGVHYIGGEYFTSKSKIDVEYNGYLFYKSYNQMTKTEPSKWVLFGMSNKKEFSIYNLKKYCIENYKLEVVQLEADYDINKSVYRQRLKYVCHQCHEIFSDYLGNIEKNQRVLCRDCSIKSRAKKCLADKDKTKKIFEDSGLEILGDVGKVDEYVPCKTEGGYIVMASRDSLLLGNSAMPFHSSNPYTIYNINLFIKINRLACKLLSTKYRTSHYHKLYFLCECGNKFGCSWHVFKNLKQTRCTACANKESNLEKKTRIFLEENNILFEKEKVFKECRYPTGGVPRFDFYLKKFNLVIECHGEQHYKESPRFSLTLKEQQERDAFKKEWCKINSIGYLEISYIDFKNNNYIKILEKYIQKHMME